jgi:hypothetical protein
MDLEWDMFDKKTRGQGKTALVQICDQDTILLVQTAKMKSQFFFFFQILPRSPPLSRFP